MACQSGRLRRVLQTIIGGAALWAALGGQAWAQNGTVIGPVQFDRPTPTALGIRLPFSGDANQNASVTIQYRASSTTVPNPNAWKPGLALWRVHPEVVTQEKVSQEFAGSLFNLAPAASYDVQLTISDADGVSDQAGTALGQTYVENLAGLTSTGGAVAGLTTRALPADPANPVTINVGTSQQLTNALSAVQPGQVIQLAPGTYTGQWVISASGTATNPIVIRGANSLDSNGAIANGSYTGAYHDNTILDGQNCSGCNILEVYGSYVHVEWVTMQNANRALRSYNATTGNAYRRIHTRNTDYGFMGWNTGAPQTDFYIADNILEGRIAQTTSCSFSSCGASSVDGIGVYGNGHVVAHNRLSGFGDALANWYTGARAVDFYGNDVLWNYDDGTELDGSEGNVRFFRNRISNSWEGISLQPVNGGPAYIFRNSAINIRNEGLKMHPESTNPTSGYLVFNNTFATSSTNSYGGHSAWNNQSSGSCYHFAVQNNLFQGPNPSDNSNEVDVTCHQEYGAGGVIDHNGYDRDFGFAFYLTGYSSPTYTPGCSNLPSTYGNMEFCNLADLQLFSPFEASGQIVSKNGCTNGSVFSACWLPPLDNTTYVNPPPDLALASGSTAAGAALLLANINDGDSATSSATGQPAPSLGAVEPGCVAPLFGPRQPGLDENSPYTCAGYENGRAATSTTIASSPNPSTSGTPVTFTATVTSSSGTPTGTVTFLDGSVALGSSVLDATGQAAYQTSSLSAGSHSISASYGGDATFDVSSSGALVQTVNAPVTPAFSLSASPASATSTRGSSVSYTVTVTPSSGFTGAVNLAVSGLPSRANATFQPNPVSITGTSAGTSKLTVTIARNTSKKSYTLTITGTAGSLTNSTSVTLVVQ